MNEPQSQAKSKTSYTRYVPAAIGLLVVIGVVVYFVRAHHPAITTKASAVSVTTTDKIALSGELTLPKDGNALPAVILVHDFGKDRHQWDPYIQSFATSGIAVLAYDVRGMGDSHLPTIPKDWNTWKNDMPKDIPSMIDYLKHQPRVDASRISMVGVNLGGSIAYVASGSKLGLHRVVMISPVVANGVLDGNGVAHFAPQGVLGIDVKSSAALSTLMNNVTAPKDQYYSPTAGIDALKDQATLGSVLSWVRS